MPARPTFVQGRPALPLPAVLPAVRAGRVLRVIERGEAPLHRPCRVVTEFGADRWASTIDDLFATMWVAEGAGLAANQVGIDAQLFVYELTDESGSRHVGHLFNPIVTAVGDEVETAEEGCLSIPGAGAAVTRAAHVTVDGRDMHGEPVRFNADHYLARCMQHEADHLTGRVYTDHLDRGVADGAHRHSARVRATVLERRAEREALQAQLAE